MQPEAAGSAVTSVGGGLAWCWPPGPEVALARYQILYWHDIPVQVRARDQSGRASKPLAERFQQAIDNAAVAAGLTGDDAYTALFHWSEAEERDGSAQEVVAAVVAELEERYPLIDWRRTAAELRPE